MNKKILIVGGVAGGASVAARARRLDEHAEIVMFERGPHVSFSNCSLPFYLNRVIDEADKLVLMNPMKFKKMYKIDARVYSEVIKVNKKEKTVLVKNVRTGNTYQESYDALYLAPGAKPIIPQSIKGIHLEHIFQVRNVVDIVKIDEYIKDHKVQHVAVIGGGFIGLEIMENLQERGLHVTLIEAGKQVMKPIDNDMVQIIHQEIVSNGVDLIVEDSVKEITEEIVITQSGKEINADIVITSIGVTPEVTLAKDAGLEIGETGGIKVDGNFRTSNKYIYAVGDAIEVHDALLHKPGRLALAGPAQRQARGAADDLYGRTVTNKGFIGSSSVKIFSMNAASTGLNEQQCLDNNIQYDYVYIIPMDRVSIIPTAEQIHLKVLFEVPTGKLLGCQAIGKGNIVKRVDVAAAMITMGASLEDLKDLELCYSPMFSTAKDPLNHAALVGINVLNGEYKQVKVSEVRSLVENNEFILDCRENTEFAEGHLKNAINIPMSEFRSRLDEIPTDRPVYVHCRTGQRSYNTVRALQQLGFDNVHNISGSYLGVSFHEFYLDHTTKRESIVTAYNFN